MPDLAKIAAVATKLNLPPEGAEPAPENAAAPPDGASGAGSAPADGADGATPNLDEGTGGGKPGTSPGAAIDHAALARKLAADRARREEKTRRKRIEDDEAAARKAREEAESERSKWANAGKDRPFLDVIKDAGRDPREVFEAMKDEALKAGTPEAKMEAMDRAWKARIDAMEAKLQASEKAREEERKEREEQQRQIGVERANAAFVSDFRSSIEDAKFTVLVDEYPPEKLLGIAGALRENPEYFFGQAKDLGVELTDPDGTFNMIDILNVMLKTQQRHQAYQEEQRRKKSAAPQSSPAGPQQPPAATKQTVNGTAERKAGNALGNQLAATRAADPASPKKETREERLKRLGDKYG